MTARAVAKMHKHSESADSPTSGRNSRRVGATVAKARWINTGMRAHEILEAADYDPQPDPCHRPRRTGSRRPTLSLHHINKLKRLKAAREAEHAQRQQLWSLMYPHPNTDQRSLDQREADLDAREQELRLRELRTDLDRAISKAEVSTQQRDHLHQLAMREVSRRMNNT